MKYYETESFAHRCAKEILTSYLQRLEDKNDFCEYHGLSWRKNYGIFPELKFYETSEPYYFETSYGLREFVGHDENGIDLRGRNPLDWFDDTQKRGKILFVPDITIFHKGTASIFIEIVHNHATEPHKLEAILNFFEDRGNNIKVYEVSATEILNNLATDDELKRVTFIEKLTN